VQNVISENIFRLSWTDRWIMEARTDWQNYHIHSI